MYTREKRMKAIELYIKYDQSAAAVIHELGYPDRRMLAKWHKTFLEEQKDGVERDRYIRNPKFSLEQKTTAVKHYLEHGRSIAKTVKLLGYPYRETLQRLVQRISARDSQETSKPEIIQKKERVIALCTRSGSAKKVTKKYGVSREALYDWKNNLLGKEWHKILSKGKARPLPDDRQAFYLR